MKPEVIIGHGSYCHGQLDARWWSGPNGKLVIGKYCSIADGVTIFLGGNHHTDWITTYPFLPEAECQTTKGDVNIGNDVWIGSGVTIMSGVTIGDGAVIGAKAVVAKDVPPYAIAYGNPAHYKYRFDLETREQLLAMAWWDWPEEKIRKNLSALCASPSATAEVHE